MGAQVKKDELREHNVARSDNLWLGFLQRDCNTATKKKNLTQKSLSIPALGDSLLYISLMTLDFFVFLQALVKNAIVEYFLLPGTELLPAH